MLRRIQIIQDAVEFGEDRIGGLGPDEVGAKWKLQRR
jgi:hypothetical protein